MSNFLDPTRPPGAEEKAWGWALTLHEQRYERDDGTLATLCRTMRVYIKPGGYSSIHEHQQSHNAFYVLDGRLLVESFWRPLDKDKPLRAMSSRVLCSQDSPYSFSAGSRHRFEALTAVHALEIYTATPQGDCGPADIIRYSQNGVKP